MAETTASNIKIKEDVTLTDEELDTGGYWVILDSADSPLIPTLTEYESVEIRCLYQGEAEKKFATIAPYMARLDSFLMNWIRDNIWEEPWGIIIKSDADLETLRRHFRKFIMVQDEAGKLMYFRFYDPRVLPTFLESCTPEEVLKFLGPVETFLGIEMTSKKIWQVH